LIEVAVLMLAATALFGAVLGRRPEDVTRMILTGVILGVLLRGLSAMAQRMLDPSEFTVIQQAMFASFGAVDPGQLIAAGVVLGASFWVAMLYAPSFDVAGLGRATSRSLGLEHDRIVKRALLLIAAMVSVSTALVGPITFLGLLSASIARYMLNTHRHALLLPGAALIGALILVSGQFIFERLLSSESALAVVVEFFGGLLFLMLVLRGKRT
jgi:iron complex transport system permease protein